MSLARITFQLGDRVTDKSLDMDGTVVEMVDHLGLIRVYWRPHGTVNAHYPNELLRIV